MPEDNPAALPKIRGTQIGLHHPAQIDQIKDDMLHGRFRYEEPRAKISGVIDPGGVYYVMTGHHRVAAAMELMRETGSALYLRMLLVGGDWDYVDAAPLDCRPLPGRDWWSWLRNLVGY